MAVVEPEHEAHDDHHDHGEFIAHHFESAEQQFDSGKLGIWLFLVTEVLFFSGLFVAYTLYRVLHPEIFDQAHVFLDKYLGFANTLVLLFSSLTMAVAVRYAQLGKNQHVVWYVLGTMVCASAFLGVKAIEYTHKWDQGIMVRSYFDYHAGHHEASMPLARALGVSDYLIWISIVPVLLLVGFALFAVFAKLTEKANAAFFSACMAIAIGGYFIGALAGHFYMELTDGGIGGRSEKAAALMAYEDETHSDHEHTDKPADHHDESAAEQQKETSEIAPYEGPQNDEFDQDIGIFFSIYYCMTGLHAIHIIAGIGFLAWILWRSILGHWRSDYFGPCDYVGLYWHLVDLIWIYLFPLLYLIN